MLYINIYITTVNSVLFLTYLLYIHILYGYMNTYMYSICMYVCIYI